MLFIFLITALISFIGSLQLGGVNLKVIQNTLTQDWKSGYWTALGGALPEFLYASLAILAASWLEKNQKIWEMLDWTSIIVFILIGVYNLRKVNNKISIDTVQSNSKSFLEGLFLGLINPQLLPYWLLVSVQMNGYQLSKIDTVSKQFAFVLGTGFGAFFLLNFFVFLSTRFLNRFKHFMENNRMNQMIGILFVLLAGIQFLNLLLKY